LSFLKAYLAVQKQKPHSMNMKKILAGVLAMAVVLLAACGDDDKTPESQFDFNGDAVLLAGANLYLTYQGQDGGGHLYRDYFITNGTFTGGDEWDIGNYENATYLIAVEAGVPVAEGELSPGKYPLYESFSDAPETSNVGWVSFKSNVDYYYTDVIGGDPVTLSGSFDDGEIMTISFKGSLHYETEGGSELVKGKLYFKGEVQDVRETILARTRSVAKGGVN
jgi:hypothetical protein